MIKGTKVNYPINNNKIGSLAYKVHFGKYKGSRLDNILYSDPSYILWLKKRKYPQSNRKNNKES